MGSVGWGVWGAVEWSSDLGEVAHGEEGGEAGPVGEVVAVVVDEVGGPGGAFGVAVGGVPGWDEVDLAGAVGDVVPVAEQDAMVFVGGVGAPEEVAGPGVAVDQALPWRARLRESRGYPAR